MGASKTKPWAGARLPPAEDSPATALTIPGNVVSTYDVRDVIADALDAFNPDIVVATPPDPAHVALPPVTNLANAPVIDPSRSTNYHWCPDAGVVFAAVPSPEVLPSTPTDISYTGEPPQSRDAIEHYYVITSHLELTIDPHHRETRLEGISDYLTALPDAWHDGTNITHLATTLRADYETVHSTADTVYPIYGAGPPTNSIGAGVDETRRPIFELIIYSNGAVSATDHDPSDFGLQGLEGIGPAKADKLRDHGFDSRDAIASTTPDALTNIRGFAEKTATKVHNSARAIDRGEIIPKEGGTLPNGDPVFIDIETDGLNGDTAWLVGVLDGDNTDGHYLSFRQQTHDEVAGHLNAFMSWLTGPAEGRPVVAWNGYDFDFPIIRQQLETHLPKWADLWEGRYQFDPLFYATTQGYATLPARSNSLEPVAAALGWEPTTVGIDGAAAAAEYNAWRLTANRPDGYQPDWDRLEAYCEDDVRALATIYEALKDANRHPPDTGTTNKKRNTSQGSLSDFS